MHVLTSDLVFPSSQLPDFLGGSCTCSGEGGCLRSNKGPWNDPDIMKVCIFVFTILSLLKWVNQELSRSDSDIVKLVRNAGATFVRQITRVSNDQEKVDSYVQILPLKASVNRLHVDRTDLVVFLI